MSQKVKSNCSFGLSHGSVQTFGLVRLEPFGLVQDLDSAMAKTKLNLNLPA